MLTCPAGIAVPPGSRRPAGAGLLAFATPPEQRLRAAMSGLQASIEQRDANELESYLAEDFVGPEGWIAKVRAAWRRCCSCGNAMSACVWARWRSTLQGEHATVQFQCGADRRRGGLLPDRPRSTTSKPVAATRTATGG